MEERARVRGGVTVQGFVEGIYEGVRYHFDFGGSICFLRDLLW